MSRVWGGIFLVAGTTVGAGMLAFPMVSIRIGWTLSFSLMVGFWGIMYQTALFTTRVILRHCNIAPLPDIAHQQKHVLSALFGHAVTIILFYALMTAYTVGAASILHQWMEQIALETWMLIFSGVFGMLVVWHVRFLDRVNRILFCALIAIFIGMLFVLFGGFDIGSYQGRTWKTQPFLQSIPIFFTAFAFHGSIPAIIRYVGPDFSKLKKVFRWGSFIPLVVYLMWQGVAIGVLPISAQNHWESLPKDDVGSFLTLLGTQVHNPYFQHLTSVFGFLAIVTSYLGVGLGLRHYMESLASRQKISLSPFKTGAMCIFIPLGCAILYPFGFIQALGFAAIMLVFLVIFLPVFLHLQNVGFANWRTVLSMAWLVVLGFFIIAIELVRLCYLFYG